MKLVALLLLFCCFSAKAQTVQTVKFDAFTERPVAQMEPVVLLKLPGNGGKLAVGIQQTTTGFQLEVAGVTWGAGTIDKQDLFVLTLQNNEQVKANSVAVQSIQQSLDPLSGILVYQHKYTISEDDLARLSRSKVISVRRYLFTEHVDATVAAGQASQFKNAATELYKSIARIAKVEAPLLKETPAVNTPVNNAVAGAKTIRLQDVAKNIGKRVALTEKVFITRFYDSRDQQATILDFQSERNGPALRAIIWKEDSDKWGGFPKTFYTGKEVTLSGNLYMYDGYPYMQVADKSQLKILSAISTEEAPFVVNDTITLTGKVQKVSASKTSGGLVITLASTASPVDILVNDNGGFSLDQAQKRFSNQDVAVFGVLVRRSNKLQLEVVDVTDVQLLSGESAKNAY